MRANNLPLALVVLAPLAILPLMQVPESFCLTAIPSSNTSTSPTTTVVRAPVQFSATAVLLQPTSPTQAQTPAQPCDPGLGEALFTGRGRFSNGGPPCISCHSVTGVPFPNGGTMGPDLTNEYTKLGPEGMASALGTLFFVTMQPLYNNRPLTPAEQQNLAAFFRQTSQSQPRRGITVEFVLVSLAGCLGLFVLNGLIWKNRLRGVRQTLVARVRRKGTK